MTHLSYTVSYIHTTRTRPMSNFSDTEDHALIQLVVKCTRDQCIDWATVEAQFPKRTKTRASLRQRLKTLKRTYGKDVQAFPPRFFRVQGVAQKRNPLGGHLTRLCAIGPPDVGDTCTDRLSIASSSSPHQTPADSPFSFAQLDVNAATKNEDFTSVGLALSLELGDGEKPSAKSLSHMFEHVVGEHVGAAEKMSRESIYSILRSIFGQFSMADIRQPSGLTHLNAGELSSNGVTTLINALKLCESDVFGDIGSGSGSVISQLVLQTSVKKCIGLEIRAGIARKCQELLGSWSQKYPRLSSIDVVCGDITVERSAMSCCTIIYSNNQLFRPEANCAIQEVMCDSINAHTVIIGYKFCHRCSNRCTKEFCQMWKLESCIHVEVCWTSKLIPMYIYGRQIIK